MAKEKALDSTQSPTGLVLHKTSLAHVFYLDIQDNGQFREVAVVKQWSNGSVAYIDIALIDEVDRGRLKNIVQSQHADKYSLWELLDQKTLGNGKNGLDYFHQMVRIKKAPGHVDSLMGGETGGSLFTTKGDIDRTPGVEFSNPTSGVIQG